MPSAKTTLAGLRPQPFGHGHPGRVLDPLIEPLWTGVRALAAIEIGAVALVDDAGCPIEDLPAVAAALAESMRAEALILDGYLTKMAARDGGGVYVAMDSLPSAGQMLGRPLLGIRSTRAEDALKAKEAAREAREFGPDDTVRFVAIDLLWLDGEPLLDVPLLERRRLLDSALTESDLVRRGVFVRPPIEAWIGSWRSLGFSGLSFKAANSRYRPGTATDEWVSTSMPRR
jgi:hypothetical protein